MTGMLYVVPFEAHHMDAVDDGAEMVQQCLATALVGPYAVTLMDRGKPIACGGAIEIWAGRAYLWSALGAGIDAHNFRRGHTFAKQFIEGLPFKRLEAAVAAGFEPGHRWMQSLGFKCETPEPMQAFAPDGSAAMLYSKVK